MLKAFAANGYRLLTTRANPALASIMSHLPRSALAQKKSYTITGSSPKNDFRQIGTEKDAGALQDLLRRVMEIDAQITNTPVEKFKPNTQSCEAYCTGDVYVLPEICNTLSNTTYNFQVQSSNVSNMIHIVDTKFGGDIYLFPNGTYTCWGLDDVRRDEFLNCFEKGKSSEAVFANESLEYTVDEDELTAIKGDVILLNPHIPSIDLSKIAFSYGLGRVAKLASIEKNIEDYLAKLHHLYHPHQPQHDDLALYRSLTRELLCVRQRLIIGSQDGFLGTPDFHWAKPELQDFVKKISERFDVYTRIQILNKKIEYATSVTNTLQKCSASEK